jgi:K+-sensing histidine kinase KdpD
MLIKSLELPTRIDIEEFISREAHDLRSPFNQVIGFGKMLINTVKNEPFSDLQKEDLNTVYRSGMRALVLMNALVDATRLNRGEKTVSRAGTSIESMLSHSVTQWKKFHPGVDHQVEYHIHTSSPTLQTDEMLAQQTITGVIAYVDLFCESPASVNVAVEEDAEHFLFTFTAKGTKARAVPAMDLELIGYVLRAQVELLGGSLLRAEENDDGASIQFGLPKE